MGKSAARVTTKPAVPPLRDGDRMTAAEFWRRYEASPHVRRAELIRGVVHIISEAPKPGEGSNVPPIDMGGHGTPHGHMIGWLVQYEADTPGVSSSAPTTVRTSRDTAPEPDALLRILPEAGGQMTVGEDGFLRGAPELAVEVSNTSAAHDLGPKFQAFQEEGVREYLVWQTRARALNWFRLNRSGRFVPLVPDETGVCRSHVFPGLWLDTTAMIQGNLRQWMSVLRLGLASPEHAAFVEKLRKRADRARR